MNNIYSLFIYYYILLLNILILIFYFLFLLFNIKNKQLIFELFMY